jgi:hypothetical protein
MMVEVMKDETISQNTLAIPFPYSLKDADWFLDYISNEPYDRVTFPSSLDLFLPLTLLNTQSLHFAIRVSNPEETFIGTIGILQMQTPLFTNGKVQKTLPSSPTFWHLLMFSFLALQGFSWLLS